MSRGLLFQGAAWVYFACLPLVGAADSLSSSACGVCAERQLVRLFISLSLSRLLLSVSFGPPHPGVARLRGGRLRRGRWHWDLLVRGASLQPFLSFPGPSWALGVLKFADLETWTKPQRGVSSSARVGKPMPPGWSCSATDRQGCPGGRLAPRPRGYANRGCDVAKGHRLGWERRS